MNEELAMKRVFEDAKTVAVVGLSVSEDRPSYMVAKYLQNRGFTIIPVNPKATEILGEKCYGSLAEIDIPIDIVTIFRRSDYVLPIVEEAIEKGVKAIWMQFGVVNEQAYQTAKNAGVEVFMDKCIKIDYHRTTTQIR
ncbi:CoA-binding protein [Desulfuribacillus alkaliarsenatis]|uniref:CoA-binding domain-containing protein n=1 Tax=Desulfuribacillus alkaliarsenatis TaxID=766136 RepID=A0A1E5G1C7_9FIRM|nr:CoA-binding protein [Desulfuribacillus alkaliarsenatis]OEF96248.1 hypothetical protein BHF68_08785 [Desulfuribacillus alkaliarsenatis]